MVYRRRTYARRRSTIRRYKKPTYRRRTYRKRWGKKRSGRTKVFNIVRSAQVVYYDVYDTTAGAALTFNASDIINYGEMSALFNQYRINCVVLKMRWTQAAAPVGTPTYPTPVIHVAPDPINASVPASVAEMVQYSGYRAIQLNGAHTWTYKVYPKAQVETYKSAVTTGYAPKKMWISCNDTTIPHFAFKMYFVANQGGGTGTSKLGILEVQKIYYTQWKSLH